MRVLHVHNIAGVSNLFVKGLRDVGIDAGLIVRKPSKMQFSYEKVTNLSPRHHLIYTIKKGKDYDLIHLHGLQYLKQFNIDIFLQKLINKRIVLHLHGSELRLNYNKLRVKVILKGINPILVSTPDLLLYCNKAIWLPNPIDPMFKPLNLERHGALYIPRWYDSGEVAKRVCEDMGLELTVLKEFIPHNEMPRFLNQFELFFDRFAIPSLSKIALEALACGCKVISWRGAITNPEEIVKNHSLMVVTEKLLKIYEKY